MVLPHNVKVSPVVSDEGRCGLQKVLHVAAQLSLQRYSTGPTTALWLLRRRGITVEHSTLGTVVLSDVGTVQYVPTLVMYPDCGPVWHGQSVLMYPDCGPVWHGQSVLMYPDCGPVWHGQSVVMYPDCGPVWHGCIVFSMYQP